MSDEPALTCDGFDDAIIGVTVHQPGRQSVVVYDAVKMIEILMRRDGMTYEDAEEFLSFNTWGAWVGAGTPVFVHHVPEGEPVAEFLCETFGDDA